MSNGLKAVAGAAAWTAREADPRSAGVPATETCAVWERVRREAEREREREPALAEFLDTTILSRTGLVDSLAWILSHELASPIVGQARLRELFYEVHASDPTIGDAARADLQAVRDRDPALETYFPALLFFKGFHALQTYRIDIGAYPVTAQGLAALMAPPDEVAEYWRGPYLQDELPDDPWRNPYQYEAPVDNLQGFFLYSFGADGARGGEGDNADIGYPPEGSP